MHLDQEIDGIRIQLVQEANQDSITTFAFQPLQTTGQTVTDITGQRLLIVIIEPRQIELQRLRSSNEFQLGGQAQDCGWGWSLWW